MHLESSTLSGCLRNSLVCCMDHGFSKTLIQFQQNCLCPLSMATDTAARQPPTSPQEGTIVDICSWRLSLWVSQAVLLIWARQSVSQLGSHVCAVSSGLIDRGPHNTLLSVPCPAAGQLGLWLWQNERDRSTQGPLNHRLGAGNSHFHHILLSKASPKANPDSKGRKTNPASSMEKLQGHIIRRRKPRER